jgi:tetratricopeptide (TPR) repeat protein
MTAEQGDDAARQAAGQFALHLRKLHDRVGNPSYADLERASDHVLKKSTVFDILHGKRVRVPPWSRVAAFVAACRKLAEETGLDPMQLGTNEGWREAYTDAREGRINPDFPGLGDPPPGSGQPGGLSARPDLASAVLPTQPRLPQTGSQIADASTSPARAGIAPLHGPVPRSVNGFIGREKFLEDLHQAFVSAERRSALAIQGPGGIGKTQLAIAYSQRYAAYYNLIWWISCETWNVAYRDMASLESRLGLTQVTPSAQEARFAALFNALRVGATYEHWLLVFDGADVPSDIEELIPPRHGHVLITSRNTMWEAGEQLIEVDVFERQESVSFLHNRMYGVSEADAQRLAEATGDFPLALEHAAVSRIPVDDYIDRIEKAPVTLLSAHQPPGYPLPVAEIWQQTIEKLRNETDSMRLLRCAAFFGGTPISLEMLDKGRYLSEISIQEILEDPMRRSRAILVLRRTGLLRLRNAPRTLELHSLTQRIVRDTLTAEEVRQYQHDVHLLLAAADPGSPGDPNDWRDYDQLRGHMGPSDIVGCVDGTVRRFVVNIATYLNAAGNPAAGRGLADAALAHWGAESTGEASTDFGATAAVFAMHRCKVDSLFSLGEYHDALELSVSVLDEMVTDGDRWWPHEVIASLRCAGTRLRVLGRFEAALEADERSVEQHTAEFSPEHPQTFLASDNLTVDNALNGEYNQAVQLAHRTYYTCRGFYESDHPAIFFYQNSLARCRRLAGQYDEALALAEDAYRGFRAAIDRGIMTESHPWVLTQEIDLAAARRDAGFIDVAFEAFVSQARDVHQSCWQAFGVDHQHTLAAAVMLGSLLRRIPGRAEEAAEEVARARHRYRATLGEYHPYSLGCSMALAGILRQNDEPASALDLLNSAIAGLEGTIGPAHPLTLNAVAALVNVLTDMDDSAEAVARGESALAGFQDSLGLDHPDTLGCAANVAAALTACGRDGEAAVLSADTAERFSRTLGNDHPRTLSSRTGGQFDPDFTPLPL